MSSLVLDSLEISGFRAFDQLEIDHLGRVNLIVGKNNVGKSCLLEALRLYAHRGAPQTLLRTLDARDELGEVREGDSVESYIRALGHLFHGWRIFRAYGRTDEFIISPLKSKHSKLVISTAWYYPDQNGGRNVLRHIDPRQPLLIDVEPEDTLPGLDIKLGEENLLSVPLNRFFTGIPYSLLRGSLQIDEVPCRFISSDGLSHRKIAALWDDIALQPEESDVLKGLDILSPDIERLNLLGHGERRNERIPMVRIKEAPMPIPLRSLGEGMNRLFGILLALANAKHGLLLIDEVDSGLHYSVHKNLWRLIFQVAQRLDVQVFATTHSWDCIAGFQQSAQELAQETGMLIRLENRQGHIVPVVFDEDRLAIATRQDIEVR